MQYPQDCGVSAIRFELRDADHPLAQVAASDLSVAHYDAGYLLCHCGMPDSWQLWTAETYAVLFCQCNGSSLPLYIGPPPRQHELGYVTANAPVICPEHPKHYTAAAVAIGYPNGVPDLGTLEAESAQELVVALCCGPVQPEPRVPRCDPVTDFSHAFIGWRLRLAAPYPIAGNESWLDGIHWIRKQMRR